MQVLSIGDRIVEGRHRIHSRFRRAVNFVYDRRLVSLVAPDVGAGPINIVVDELRTAGVRALTIGTGLGPVEGKVGWLADDCPRFAPEFESCRAVADGQGVPLRAVYEAAQKAFDPDELVDSG